MLTRVMAFVGYNDDTEYENQKKKVFLLKNLQDGPDIVSDVSTCFSKGYLWKSIVEETDFIAAAVPAYHSVVSNAKLSAKALLADFYAYAKGGVKILTIHPTPDSRLIELAASRAVPVTSRGGKIIIKHCLSESWLGNVYADILDEIKSIALDYNICVSIGSAFRASNIFDALDAVNVEEIKKQILIAQYFRDFGVHAIIEGPGHIPLDRIADYAALVGPSGISVMPLGPIVSEYGAGTEHISAAVGATALGLVLDVENIAIVTPAEHSGGIPSFEDSLTAIQTAKTAAHIINLTKNKIDSIDRNNVLLRTNNKSCMNVGKCYRCGALCPLEDS